MAAADLRPSTRAVVRPAQVAPDAFSRVFRVPPEHAGMRVDVFLSTRLRNTSRTRAKLIAERGVFSVEGQKLRASDRLRAEARIVVWRSPIDEADEARSLHRLGAHRCRARSWQGHHPDRAARRLL